MRCIFPNPKDDRTWTRGYWKKMDQYCRTIDKIVTPLAETETQRQLTDLILYGYSISRIRSGMSELRDAYDQIIQMEETYLHNRITKPIGEGEPCSTCGGKTIAYAAMDECPACKKCTIKMRRRP